MPVFALVMVFSKSSKEHKNSTGLILITVQTMHLWQILFISLDAPCRIQVVSQTLCWPIIVTFQWMFGFVHNLQEVKRLGYNMPLMSRHSPNTVCAKWQWISIAVSKWNFTCAFQLGARVQALGIPNDTVTWQSKHVALDTLLFIGQSGM